MKNIILAILVSLTLAACALPPPQTSKTAAGKIESQAADNLFSAGNYKQAAESYKELADLSGNNDILFKYAESLRLSGDTKNALAAYDKLLASNPDLSQALEGKSLCYVQDGDFKTASELLTQIINKDATKWRAINALGIIYAINGQKKESLEYFNMALQISPNNPTILNNMGLAMAFSGDFDNGRKTIEKSLTLIGSNDTNKRKTIEFNLALVYGISGKMNEAEKILSKYLERPAVLNNLGFYANLANNKNEAKKYLSDALAASPVHYEKAWENLQGIK